VDLSRGTAERQQTAGHDGWGVWSPDGKRLAFLMADRRGLGLRAFPFSNDPVAIEGRWRASTYPKQWVAGDQLLSNFEGVGSLQGDVVSVSVGDGSVRPVVATSASEQQPALSPDGRWLAYQSDGSGTNEIYVQSFPEPGQREAVSTGGGVEPVWAANGSELYYRRGNTILAVPVLAGPQFRVKGPPVALFTRPYDFTQTGNWTLGPGGRFLMIKADPTTTTRFQVVLNWFEEIRTR
jgi:hypothetical protein